MTRQRRVQKLPILNDIALWSNIVAQILHKYVSMAPARLIRTKDWAIARADAAKRVFLRRPYYSRHTFERHSCSRYHIYHQEIVSNNGRPLLINIIF